eukprot:1692913-Alexandrium_andersonii.AAC.1
MDHDGCPSAGARQNAQAHITDRGCPARSSEELIAQALVPTSLPHARRGNAGGRPGQRGTQARVLRYAWALATGRARARARVRSKAR